LNCAFYSHWPLSTGEILSLISIVDWIPRETRSAAFAIVLGVRSRSSRVRSWIWVEAPRRWTERDLANFATYIPCRGRLVPSPEGWYILCRVDWFQARRAGTSSAGVDWFQARRAGTASAGVDWFQARRAGTSSAGVEGPGCRCKIKSERPGGPTHRIYYA
jgi:hypothetical protein